jgi:hypothetical protein
MNFYIKVWAAKSKFSALLDADDGDVDLGSDDEDNQDGEGENIRDTGKVENDGEELIADTKENEKQNNENIGEDNEETEKQNVQEDD